MDRNSGLSSSVDKLVQSITVTNSRCRIFLILWQHFIQNLYFHEILLSLPSQERWNSRNMKHRRGRWGTVQLFPREAQREEIEIFFSALSFKCEKSLLNIQRNNYSLNVSVHKYHKNLWVAYTIPASWRQRYRIPIRKETCLISWHFVSCWVQSPLRWNTENDVQQLEFHCATMLLQQHREECYWQPSSKLLNFHTRSR